MTRKEFKALVDDEHLRVAKLKQLVHEVGPRVGLSLDLTRMLAEVLAMAAIEAMPTNPVRFPAAFTISQTLTLAVQALAEGRGTKVALMFANVMYPERLVSVAGRGQGSNLVFLDEIKKAVGGGQGV